MSSTAESLAPRLDAVAREGAERLPASASTAFAAERHALAAAGVPDDVLTPGSPMPDGELLDVDGAPTTLTATRAGRPAVVVLYRGAWCPFCSATLHAYQEQLVGALADRGVALIAVSPQAPDGSLSTKERGELTFDVVSDPGNQIATGLGVVFQPGTESIREQQGLGLDVAAGNADGTAALPMPTVALVDASGTLRWIDVHPDFGTRTEPAEILDAVQRLLAPGREG